MPFSQVLCPFNAFPSEPQLAWTGAANKSNTLAAVDTDTDTDTDTPPIVAPLAKQVGDSIYCTVPTAP